MSSFIVYTAVVTPFDSTGSVDYNAFETLCRDQFFNGVSGLVIGGTTGESPTLTIDELLNLIKIVCSIRNEAYPTRHIIVGAGSNNTKSTIERIHGIVAALILSSAKYLNSEIDRLMIVLPYYNKPNFDGLQSHIKNIILAQQFEGINLLPLMLYHIPGRTGQKLSYNDLAKLCNNANTEFPGSICSIKEATGELNYAHELREGLDTQVAILSGDDSLFLTSVLRSATPRSFDGVVSVLSNIKPAELVEYCVSPSFEQFLNLNSMTEFLFRISNPIPVKYYLSTKMNIGTSFVRLPLLINNDVIQRLDHWLSQVTDYRPNILDNVYKTQTLGVKLWIMPFHSFLNDPLNITLICSDKKEVNGFDIIVAYEWSESHGFFLKLFNSKGVEIMFCGESICGFYNYALNILGKDIENFKGGRDGINFKCKKMPGSQNVAVNVGQPLISAVLFKHQSPLFDELNYYDSTIKGHIVEIHCETVVVVYVKNLISDKALELLGDSLQELFPKGMNLILVHNDFPQSCRVQVYNTMIGLNRSCCIGVAAAVTVGKYQNWLQRDTLTNVASEYGVVEVNEEHGQYWIRVNI